MAEPDDFERRAKRLLRRLSHGNHLRRCADASYVVAGPQEKSEQPLPAELIAALCAQGRLKEENGVLVAAGKDNAPQHRTAEENPFAAQHRLLATRRLKDENGRERYVVINAAESPLGALYQRGLVEALQFEAGERLRRDFTLAQLTPRMGVDYSAAVGRRSHRPETLIADTALAARQRFNRALQAAGPGLSEVLFDVCCYLRGLEECERLRRWPRASARVVLRIALDRLAEHYGLHPARGAAIRSWTKEEEKEEGEK
jgi:hypothetical protein